MRIQPVRTKPGYISSTGERYQNWDLQMMISTLGSSLLSLVYISIFIFFCFNSLMTSSLVCGYFIIIPSDREEYLYLLNLRKMKMIKKQQQGGEQRWLNQVYLWEKFDIGLEFNLRTGVVQVSLSEIFSQITERSCYQLEERDGRLGAKCHYFPLGLVLQAWPLS